MVRVSKNDARQCTLLVTPEPNGIKTNQELTLKVPPVPPKPLVTLEPNGNKTKQELNWEVPPVPPKPPSRLLYLVQAESCLPDNLKSTVIFRNSIGCQCDVVVLSYKQACSDPSSPAHVEYISASSPTSWNKGRNLLFEVAKQRKEKYLYYVFMDDDIILEAKSEVGDPWKIFENFLRRIEPAVAAIETDENPSLQITYEARKVLGCALKGTFEYIPAANYDAALNAFHYQAVDYILPYPLKYDAVSWWFTTWYILIKSKVIFPRQVVLHTGLLVRNMYHRPYPRKWPSAQNFKSFVRLVESDLPPKYQNSTLLLEWKKYGISHGRRSRVTCLLPPPPKMPIQPFTYTIVGRKPVFQSML